jgi:hypothetical protein
LQGSRFFLVGCVVLFALLFSGSCPRTHAPVINAGHLYGFRLCFGFGFCLLFVALRILALALPSSSPSSSLMGVALVVYFRRYSNIVVPKLFGVLTAIKLIRICICIWNVLMRVAKQRC